MKKYKTNEVHQILHSHYLGMARLVVAWAGIVAIFSTLLSPMGAFALGTQMKARGVTPVTLAAGVTTSYAISFTPGTTGTIGSLKIEICDSPLESAGCVASASAGINSNGANAAAATFTTLTGTGCTGGTWAVGVGTGPGVSGTSRKLTNSGTAVAPTNVQTCVLTFGGIVNPAGNNQNYYLRLTTYSDTAYTTEVDFGGFALQTAQNLNISASVQEQLKFCVGQTVTIATNCGTIGGAAVSLGTGTGCPVLSVANNCTGTSQFAVQTNASLGYNVSYLGTTLTGPSDTITETGAAGVVSTIATKQFGIAGTAIAGSGTGAWNATYNFGTNGSKYTFQNATTTSLATAGGPMAENVFTVTYMANISNITKPGLYTSTFNYVCTGNF